MKEKATIYDWYRMCKHHGDCQHCLLEEKICERAIGCSLKRIDEINEIILNWCKEHPVKTRQDKFLEMFPNAARREQIIDICPKKIGVSGLCRIDKSCSECRKSYWLEEVEE